MGAEGDLAPTEGQLKYLLTNLLPNALALPLPLQKDKIT
jgi:hypothetical protein